MYHSAIHNTKEVDFSIDVLQELGTKMSDAEQHLV